MKTCKTILKSNSKIKFILYFLVAVLITGCSKDDSVPAAVEIAKSSAKQITSFVFLLTNNPIDVNVVATINEEAKTITATMPPGTSLSGLLPEVKISDLATIDIDTAQDFSNPLKYTVTAEDGSTAVYTVSMTALLTQRQILQAILDANSDHTLPWDLENTAELDSLLGVSTNVEGRIIELSMQNANLTQLPKEIEQLTNLTALIMENNKFSSFPMEIVQLISLSSLNLNRNKLTSLPAEIGQLTNLTSLNLSGNELTFLPSEIRKLTNLMVLGLGTNQLTYLPTEIEQLINLERLNLAGNQLTSLSSGIEQLTQLKLLSLRDNQLTSLPTEVGQLINLVEFSLRNNQLTSIPPEIGQLVNLVFLRLSDNQLTSLPAEIGQLRNIDILNLERNQLTSLPPELAFLRNFRLIDLRENNLTTIPQAICNIMEFSTNTRLRITTDDNVSCQTISQKDALISIYSANPDNTLAWGVDNYPEVTFNNAGNPTVITMNNKNLDNIPSTIFYLLNLETLNINDNNLRELSPFLYNIEPLEVISAAGNNLRTVPEELTLLNNLVLLSITNNPIDNIPQAVCDLQTTNGGILTILTDPGEGCD